MQSSFIYFRYFCFCCCFTIIDDDDTDDDDDDDDDYEDMVEELNSNDPLVLSEQDAEFNDYDGATDVDIEDDLSPPDLLFYRQFVQPMGGEQHARDIVRPYLPQILQLIRDHYRLYDIQVKDVAGKVPPKLTTNGGVYVTIQKDMHTIITVGSTSNFKKRMEYAINVSTCTVLLFYHSIYTIQSHHSLYYSFCYLFLFISLTCHRIKLLTFPVNSFQFVILICGRRHYKKPSNFSILI